MSYIPEPHSHSKKKYANAIHAIMMRKLKILNTKLLIILYILLLTLLINFQMYYLMKV